MAGETGDRVNFVDNERLDKDDALAMQTLGQAAQTRTLGAIFGTAGLDTALYGGVLEGVAATWDGTLKALTVGKGLFLDSQQGTSPSGGTVARVVRHDPSTPGQNSVVDLTAQAATSAACIIWGKRREINGPLGTRRKWNVGTEAEQNLSLATTIAERVEFTVRAATFSGSVPTAYTDPGSTWFPVLGIRSWTTGTPNTLIMGAFDAYRNGGGTFGDVGSTMLATGGLLANGVSMGLARILKVVRMSLARIVAQDGTQSWLTQGVSFPYLGLKELQNVGNGPRLFGAGTYEWDAGTSAFRRVRFPGEAYMVISPDILPLSITPTSAGVLDVVYAEPNGGAGIIHAASASCYTTVVSVPVLTEAYAVPTDVNTTRVYLWAADDATTSEANPFNVEAITIKLYGYDVTPTGL